MKKPLVVSLSCLLFLGLNCCQKPKSGSGMNNQAGILQGVCGTIVWKEGNQMPSPDRPASQGKPVQRDVVVYERTNMNQVTSDGVFHRNIKTKLVKRVASDANGRFCVDLPEGQYSVFVWEESKGLYANSFDGENDIFPVTVRPGNVERITLTVDYAAAY
ncbi:MAG: carboxypeptidase regulatory-like domain-containing protein [Ferruginibacter sp.]|nr:carboxypeptidase regulatory-like domain-containing protein [Cytophagales bacterium]